MATIQGSPLLRPSFSSPPLDVQQDPSPFANVDEIYKVVSEVIGAIALPLGGVCILACPLGVLSWSVGAGIGAGLLALAIITWAVTSSHFREQNEGVEAIRQAMAEFIARLPSLDNALPLIQTQFHANIQKDFWTYIFKNELLKPKGPLGFERLCQALMDRKDLNMMDVIGWYETLEKQRIAAGVPGTNYAIALPGDFRRKWRAETKDLPCIALLKDGVGVPNDIIHKYNLNKLRDYKILNAAEQQLLDTLNTEYLLGHDPQSLNIQYDTFRAINRGLSTTAYYLL